MLWQYIFASTALSTYVALAATVIANSQLQTCVKLGVVRIDILSRSSFKALAKPPDSTSLVTANRHHLLPETGNNRRPAEWIDEPGHTGPGVYSAMHQQV